MSTEPTKPSESVVQKLLAERRELRIALERMRLELAEVRSTSRGPSPRLNEMEIEVAGLRAQVDDLRAQLRLLSVERDGLREGVLRALDQLRKQQK